MARPTKHADPRGGHTRLYWEIQDSMAWRALGFSAQALYMAMRRHLLSTNNGNIEATLSTLRHFGFTAPSTLAKALRELQAVGLVAKTRQGGIARGTKFCSLYRFTDIDVFEQKKVQIEYCAASNDWRQFKTLAEAERAIDVAHVQAKRPVNKNASCIQKMYPADTDSVVRVKNLDTDSVQEGNPLQQILYKREDAKKAVNPLHT